MKHLWLWILAVISCVADLVSKHYIFLWLYDKPFQNYIIKEDWLNFSLHINKGAVWGVGGSQPMVLLLVTALIIPAVVLMAYSCKDEGAPIWSLGLVLGGAVGNLYDRIFTTEKLYYSTEPISGVRDFIDMRIPGVYNWPVYNIADIAIVAGVAIFVFWNLFLAPKDSSTTEEKV